MANKLQKIMGIKVFPNAEGAAKWSNSKFTPWKDGSSADITLRGDKQYRVSVFENDDGSLGISLSESVPYHAADNLHDNIQQGGLRKVAETQAVKRNAISLDDEIPF